MHEPILVTGGTGTIGRRVVPLMREIGSVVRVLSRRGGEDSDGVRHCTGDTVQDIGLDAAFDGASVVLHLAGGARGDDVAAQNVVAAARRASVRHLLLISVIGADRMPIGYFRAKAAAEATVAGSGVPWTVLRVAQLHDFVVPVITTLRRMPLLIAPGGLRFEPVGVDEVAARLVQLAAGEPVGRTADLAGPEVLDIVRLAAAYADVYRLRGRARLPVRLPGAVGRAYHSGENLAGPEADRGSQTWVEFLEQRAADAV